MCVTPSLIHVPHGPKYKRLEVPCGYCWACIKNKQSNLMAKCLMELDVCEWSFAATLTYDDKKIPAGERSAEYLNKYDLKKHLAHLRRSFPDLKFLAAGEYGKRNGRAHFHVAYLGRGQRPEILPYKKFGDWKYWPHGHSYFDEVTVDTFAYIAKYYTKSRQKKVDEEPTQEWVTYSKYPPLGIDFVLNKADQHVEERVFPRSFSVTPPGSDTINRKFQITGTSQHLFLDRIYEQWPEAVDLQKTEWMENATRRWLKWRARRDFDALPLSEQLAILNEGFKQTGLTTRTEAALECLNVSLEEYLSWLGKTKTHRDARDQRKSKGR